MKPPAPMLGAIHELEYRETYTGIPLRIRLFMLGASMAAFMVVVTPLLVVIVLTQGWLKYVAAAAFYVLWFMQIVPRLDIFVPLGFHMFKWLITVK